MKPTLFLTMFSVSIFTLAILLFHIHHMEDYYEVRKGSSLSSSYSPKKDRTYWLSPSGNFAFGFYPLCSDCDDPRYVVGIWLVKTDNKTLVWVANRDDPPLNNLSSIIFDGRLILETKTRKKNNLISGVEHKPLLPQVSVPAAYAKLYDCGNFVLYNYDSEIIWESFNHPTNTILGGQQLSTGQTLLSYGIWENALHTYTLGIASQININSREYIEIHRHNGSSCVNGSCFRSSGDSNVIDEPMTLNLDAADGRLYVVNGSNVVLQNITHGDENKCEHDTVIYRGTMDPDGIFRLYKEKMMGSQGGKSILLWDTRREEVNLTKEFFRVIIGLNAVICILACYICLPIAVAQRKKLDLERK